MNAATSASGVAKVVTLGEGIVKLLGIIVFAQFIILCSA